jgi:hypothetical protein
LPSLSGWWFQTWLLFSISYMGCHPSHWLSYFSRWLKQPTTYFKLRQRRVGPFKAVPSSAGHRKNSHGPAHLIAWLSRERQNPEFGSARSLKDTGKDRRLWRLVPGVSDLHLNVFTYNITEYNRYIYIISLFDLNFNLCTSLHHYIYIPIHIFHVISLLFPIVW